MNEKRSNVDLHMHSNASDGLYTPARLVELSAGFGLAAIALTDHDTFSGIDEAVRAGAAHGVEVVPGIELSTYEGDREYHVLGYYVSEPSRLVGMLENLRLERFRRMKKMIGLLNELGLSLGFEEVMAAAAPAAPGRLHLARVMVGKGFTRSIREAFLYYLKRGRPAFVPRASLTPERAVLLLREAGAVSVLAHPGPGGREILPRLISFGLQGIEVFHPDHSMAWRRHYYRRAREAGLLITGGSDFHGDLKENRHPGCQKIPYRYLKSLKESIH